MLQGLYAYGASYQKGFDTAKSSKRRIVRSYGIPGPSLSLSSLSNTKYIWPLPFLCDNVAGKVWLRCLLAVFLAFCTCGVPLRCVSKRANDPTSNHPKGETAERATFFTCATSIPNRSSEQTRPLLHRCSHPSRDSSSSASCSSSSARQIETN